jgi:hypothetical protein
LRKRLDDGAVFFAAAVDGVEGVSLFGAKDFNQVFGFIARQDEPFAVNIRGLDYEIRDRDFDRILPTRLI